SVLQWLGRLAPVQGQSSMALMGLESREAGGMNRPDRLGAIIDDESEGDGVGEGEESVRHGVSLELLGEDSTTSVKETAAPGPHIPIHRRGLSYPMAVLALSTLYLTQNLAFNMSVRYTSVSIVTCITSASPVVVCMLAPLLLSRLPSLTTVLACAAAVIGAILITLCAPALPTVFSLTMSSGTVGALLSLLSLALGTLYRVLYERWLGFGSTGSVIRFLGWLGVCHLLFTPMLPILDAIGIEEWVWPTGEALTALLWNGAIGLTVNILQILILTYVGAALQSACLSLCVVTAFCLDLGLGRVAPSGYGLIGAWVGVVLSTAAMLAVISPKEREAVEGKHTETTYSVLGGPDAEQGEGSSSV
ncbi:hypothetical protein KIPB_010414, partial [Kipferlia bialata]